jgi:hypothetical protein
MSAVGDASLWGDLFPDNLIPDILQLVVDTWQSFSKPASSDHEVPISRRFCEDLRRGKDQRSLPFSIWPESSETDPESGKELGRIDIRFVHGYRERVYFAFECKRLRINQSNQNIGEYVGKNGMVRFINGKYAKSLDSGGMIGYVMDGEVTKAIAAVSNAIENKSDKLNLLAGTGMTQSSFVPNGPVNETYHTISAKMFTIYHLFLGIPKCG